LNTGNVSSIFLSLNSESASARRLPFSLLVLRSCSVEDYLWLVETQATKIEPKRTLEKVGSSLAHSSVDVCLYQTISKMLFM
jgi:hypothetical protein